MKKIYTTFLVLVSISTLSVLISRNFRPSKMPHGGVDNCASCHVSAGGGGTRTAFGEDVNSLVTAGGTETFWGPNLAAIDSDGDGFTNGQELQDPDGTWIEGTALPGDANAVTNPGDPNDHPPVTSVDNFAELPNEYQLHNNYPNPFNPTTTISFSIPENSNVKLEIYNSVGQLVTQLVNQNYAPGKYTSLWNGRNDFGAKVNSGIYFYRITTNNFAQTNRMVLMK